MRISDWSSDVCSSDLTCFPPISPPVKATLDTRGSVTNASPTSCPNPVTTLNTPSGIPAFSTRLANSSKEADRSEEHTSELQSLMRTSYAVFCLKKKTKQQRMTTKS